MHEGVRPFGLLANGQGWEVLSDFDTFATACSTYMQHTRGTTRSKTIGLNLELQKMHTERSTLSANDWARSTNDGDISDTQHHRFSKVARN